MHNARQGKENGAMKIACCPSCGSPRIKKVRGTVSRVFEGKPYSVSGVSYHVCPDCDERVYDRAAVRKIQAASPAFRRQPSVR